MIDTEKFSKELRARAIDVSKSRILLTRFAGSEQSKDFTQPANCNGLGRIHHFRRSQGDHWPENPLPIDPAARFLGEEPQEVMRAQVFQNAICNWRCWYCFVDFSLLAGRPERSEFVSAGELVDLYLMEPERPAILDLSGGQPDLVPEWVLWTVDELRARSLESLVYLWSDDNLSNDYLWRFLSRQELRRLAGYPNYGRVGCFKGFDEESFCFNTGAEPALFYEQFSLMRRLVDDGFDVYGYITLTSPSSNGLAGKMSDLLDHLQSIHPLFPLRTVPLRVFEFTPTKGRLTERHLRSLSVQMEAVAAWNEELSRRFSAGDREKRIYDHALR